MEQFTPYPKPDKFLGKRKDESQSEITPMYDIQTGEEIARGNFGSIKNTTMQDIDGQVTNYVQKQNVEESSSGFEMEKIIKDMATHKELQDANIPTFKNYQTDGKAFYSPSLDSVDHTTISPTDSRARYEALNRPILESEFGQIENQILDMTKLASENNIMLKLDCFLITLSLETADHPKVIVGDFDLVETHTQYTSSELEVLNQEAADGAMRMLRRRSGSYYAYRREE